MHSDLECALCHKVSDNKKAHIRHTSYCRKKAKTPVRSRRRSCLACIKAKTHCDVALALSCTRCRQKGIECHLEHSAPSARRTATTPAADNDDSRSSDALIRTEDQSLLVDWDDAVLDSITLDELQDVNLSELGHAITVSRPQQRSSAWAIPSAKTDTDIWLPRTSPSSLDKVNFHALGPQLNLQPIKAFKPRQSTWGPLSLLGKYVAQTIRQYPFMLLSDKTLPPFIHYQCFKSTEMSSTHSNPGPLLRCSAIVDLWRGKTRINAPYLWKILRMEQERIMQEMSEYEDLAAVNALQAVTIYFLLRVSSADEEGTDFDVPLIQTMAQLFSRVKDIMTVYQPESFSRPDVCIWVMSESLQRTIATLFIVELLFDISPGMMSGRCNSLALWSAMPLPCDRYLWEAETQAAWVQQYDRAGDERPYYGELLRHESLDYARSKLLEQWMTNADEFGKLVINIASVAEAACS